MARVLGNDDEQVVIAPCPSFFMSFPIIQLALFSTSYIPSKLPKRTTSGSRLDAREVVVVGASLKHRKTPPPAHVRTQGRWWWEPCRNTEKNHLQLAFRHEGGGGGSHVETPKKTTSGSHLNEREVVWWQLRRNSRKQPPPARVWTQGRW